jgi:transcriptional regulator with XRE-family HTH domain
MEKPLESLREKIKKLMDARNWKQADLARALNWQQQYLSNYMNSTEPGLDKINEIADVFGVSIGQLFDLDGMDHVPRYAQTTPLEAVEIVKQALTAQFKGKMVYLPQFPDDILGLLEKADNFEVNEIRILLGAKMKVEREIATMKRVGVKIRKR